MLDTLEVQLKPWSKLLQGGLSRDDIVQNVLLH